MCGPQAETVMRQEQREARECDAPRWMEMAFNPELRRWRKAHMGGDDMVMRVDPNGEACWSGAENVRVALGAFWARN